MPREDQTGPMGMGPMSGRGAGFCAGYDGPGYAYPGYPRRGIHRMWRGHGWFSGHGMHRHGYGWGPMDFVAYEVPYPAELTPEEKVDMLSTREAWLREQLDEVHRDLENLQKETQTKSEKKDKKEK